MWGILEWLDRRRMPGLPHPPLCPQPNLVGGVTLVACEFTYCSCITLWNFLSFCMAQISISKWGNCSTVQWYILDDFVGEASQATGEATMDTATACDQGVMGLGSPQTPVASEQTQSFSASAGAQPCNPVQKVQTDRGRGFLPFSETSMTPGTPIAGPFPATPDIPARLQSQGDSLALLHWWLTWAVQA